MRSAPMTTPGTDGISTSAVPAARSASMNEPRPQIELKILDPRLHHWGLPDYQTAMSAGIDMYACIEAPMVIQPQAAAVLIPSGIALLMNDPHMVGFLLARSGLGHKKGLVLSQAVGTIDADYTAQIYMSVWLRNPPGSEPVTISPGDRIAQLVFLPILRPSFSVVDEFSQATERGEGGFGSTGVTASAI
jgi:dUTP pyrophosphatase